VVNCLSGTVSKSLLIAFIIDSFKDSGLRLFIVITFPETTSGSEPLPDDIIGIPIAELSTAVNPNPSE
jgi:hypothetical protein